MSCSSSHSLAHNPCEDMLQLLVHQVFCVLIRESPPDDILNELRRRPLSSSEGPWGSFPLDPAPPLDRQRGRSGVANKAAEWQRVHGTKC